MAINLPPDRSFFSKAGSYLTAPLISAKNFLPSANHFLNGNRDSYLSQFISGLESLKNNVNQPQLIQELSYALADMKNRPFEWKLPSDHDLPIDQLIELLRQQCIDINSLKAKILPFKILNQKSLGVVATVLEQLQDLKADSLEEVKGLLISPFEGPKILSELITLLDSNQSIEIDSNQSIKNWNQSHNHHLHEVFYGKNQHQLSQDEQLTIFSIAAQLDSYSNSDLNETEIEQLKKTLKAIFENRAGAIRRFELIFDRMKEDLIHPKHGLATTCVKQLIQSAKSETLKQAPPLLQALYEEGLNYQSKKTAFAKLLESYQKWHGAAENTQKNLESPTEQNFQEWFKKLKTVKDENQGMICQLSDLLKEKFQSTLSPFLSLFPNNFNLDSNGPHENSSSFINQLIRLIQHGKHSLIKQIALVCFQKALGMIQNTSSAGNEDQKTKELKNHLESIIDSIRTTDFNDESQKNRLIDTIKSYLGNYQIMLDNMISLPNFHLFKDDSQIHEFIKAVNEYDTSKIKKWTQGKDLKKVLFEDDSNHIATEQQKERLITLLTELSSESNSSFESKEDGNPLNEIKSLVEAIFIKPADQDIDLLNATIDTLSGAKVQDEEITSDKIQQITKKTKETSSFYLVHFTICRILGLNLALNKLEKDHDAILRTNPSDAVYAAGLQDIQYQKFEKLSFASVMKNVNDEDRRGSFIDSMQQMLQASDINYVLKSTFSLLLPFFVDIFLSISSHMIDRSIEIIKATEPYSPTSVDRSLDTKVIKQISGYLIKLINLYKEAPEKNKDRPILDWLTSELKKEIRIGEDQFSIPDLFSNFNYKLVEVFLPLIESTKKLNELSDVLLTQVTSENNTGLFLLKALTLIPIYAFIQAFNLFLVLPFESAGNFLIKNLAWGLLDWTSIVKKLTELSFRNLSKSTGLYQIIKQPLTEFIETFTKELEEAFKKDENAPISMLSTQTQAKREIKEMYNNLKEAAAWFKVGVTNRNVQEANGDPQNFIDKFINRFESAYFSEELSELTIKLIHKITQPKFIEEKIIYKGLKNFDQFLTHFGHVKLKDQLVQAKAMSDQYDTRFKNATDSLMHKLPEKLLKFATAELGSKQKEIIEDLFSFINSAYESIKVPRFNDGPVDPKVYLLFLIDIKNQMLKISGDLLHKKQNYLSQTCIDESTKKKLDEKIKIFEKANSEFSKKLIEEIDLAKENFEYTHFLNHKSRLTDDEGEIIDEIAKQKATIEQKHTTSYTKIEGSIRSYSSQLENIKSYQIDQRQEFPLTTKTTKFKSLLTQEKLHLFNETFNFLKILEGLSILEFQLSTYRRFLVNTPSQPRYRNYLFFSNSPEEPNDVIKSILTKKIKIESLTKHFEELMDKKDQDKFQTNLESFKSKVQAFKGTYSQELDKAIKNLKKNAQDEKFEDEPVKINFDSILSSFDQLKKTSQSIKRFEFLNLSVLDQKLLPIELGKKIIINNRKDQILMLKEFFNSPHINETFFYNCILPNLI